MTYNKKYYEKNKDKMRQSQRKWYLKRKEKFASMGLNSLGKPKTERKKMEISEIIEKRKKHYIEKKDSILKKQREKYHSSPELRKSKAEYLKEWRKKNHEKTREYNQKSFEYRKKWREENREKIKKGYNKNAG